MDLISRFQKRRTSQAERRLQKKLDEATAEIARLNEHIQITESENRVFKDMIKQQTSALAFTNARWEESTRNLRNGHDAS